MLARRKPQIPYYTPKPQAATQQAKLTYRKPYDEMTPQEGVTWLKDLRDRLSRKQQRERAYLDRRAARGAHTPTDEAYEADQILEDELLMLLDELATRLAEEV